MWIALVVDLMDAFAPVIKSLLFSHVSFLKPDIYRLP